MTKAICKHCGVMHTGASACTQAHLDAHRCIWTSVANKAAGAADMTVAY